MFDKEPVSPCLVHPGAQDDHPPLRRRFHQLQAELTHRVRMQTGMPVIPFSILVFVLPRSCNLSESAHLESC